VIIPDGEIGYIPFEMLKNDAGKMLIETCTISYAYEYETRTPGQNASQPDYKIFCLAPSYPINQNDEQQISRGSLYNLPYAKAEVDSIQRLFGSEALVSVLADKDSFYSGLQKAAIFHFAGHALAAKDHAYLALCTDDNTSCQLSEEAIALMSQSSDMVVLSACETGLGKLEAGEGIRSLGRSFIESGASSTVISLWTVNDKSTSAIMVAFYRNLLQGMSKDAALRNAKLQYISMANKISRHPYFWAAFIPAGDMRSLSIRSD
jgi:CHAT domain-containing protein